MTWLSKRTALAVLGTLLALLVSACGGDSESPSTSGATSEQKKATVGVSYLGDCPYCATWLRSLKEKLASHNLTPVVTNAQFKADLQSTQIIDLVNKKVDALIVFPVDKKAIVPSLAKAKAAGIKVIVSNSIPDKAGQQYMDAFTGPNDVKHGEIIANKVHEDLGGTGNVLVIMGLAGTSPQIDRLAGFEQQLDELGSQIKILDAQPADWDQAKAQTVTGGLLSKYGDRVDAIYGQDDTLAIGAYMAAKDAGLDDEIKIYGIGGSGAGLKAVEAGQLAATDYQSPKADGELAADAASRALAGEKQPKIQYIDTPLITKENVSEFPALW